MRIKMGSMRKRIILSQLVFAVIPFIIIMVFVINAMNNQISKKEGEYTHSRLATASQSVEDLLSAYLARSRLIVDNGYCLSTLSEVVRGSYSNLLDLKELIHSLTLDLVPANSRDISLTLYVEDYSFGSSTYVEPLQHFPNNELAAQILSASSREVFWEDGLFTNSNGDFFLVFYRHLSSFNRDAIIRMDIPYSEIKSILAQYAGAQGESVFIHQIPGFGTILFYKDQAPQFVYDEFSAERYYLYPSQPLADGSTLTIGIEKQFIQGETIFYYFISFGLMLTVLLLILVASSRTTANITRELNQFIDTIALTDPNPSPAMPPTFDEIKIIKNRFTNVLQDRENAHKSLLEEKSRSNLLEIDLLQSRLNPHMLYNSLSSIRMCAIANNSDKTAEIVDALTSYYRLALNNGIDIVTVSQEIQLITQYVNIINLTYARNCKLVVDISPDILRMQIFKHLLQPIAENALHHGLHGMREGSALEISGKMWDNYLVFQLKDNGTGIEEPMIEKLLNLEYDSAHGGFGIKSLIQKIKLFYGEDCGLAIENLPTGGLLVTVTVKEIKES